MSMSRWSPRHRETALRRLFATTAEIETRRYSHRGLRPLRDGGLIVSRSIGMGWRHALTDAGRAARDRLAETR